MLAGGAKGKRIALPNAEIMIHQPSIHGNGVQGQATDIKIVSENTGRTIEEVAIATERDNFLSVEEALDFWLIDKIIDAR